MLEKIDLNKTMSKEEYDQQMDRLTEQIGSVQRACIEEHIPILIVVEGLGASGKGTLINRLIQPLDPRGFHVYAIKGETEEEKRHPFLWRFWTKTPAKGRMVILDRSWYRRVTLDRFEGRISDKELRQSFDEISSFENQLVDDGTVIIKLFTYISKKEQKQRMDGLLANKETAWRVTAGDLKRNSEYEKYLHYNEEMLFHTDFSFAPWTIVEATDKRFATVKILSTVVNRLSEELKMRSSRRQPVIDSRLGSGRNLNSSILGTVDLSVSLSREQYHRKKKELQKRLGLLHSELYRRRIPVVLAFEGWDAGGKGGAIKRLTQALDPRGYAVHPTSAPNDLEKSHHYLWRFWNQMPKSGHIAIFDRTWYGRVMVERIEGFCSVNEWERAYKEINDMEKHIANFGTVVLKFWMQIDRDEQKRRFQMRQEDPAKAWKITDEDWRNREKWDLYEEAVDEMLIRTSTSYAPWMIVEGNDKLYARIKVLQAVVDAIEHVL